MSTRGIIALVVGSLITVVVGLLILSRVNFFGVNRKLGLSAPEPLW